jgi:hypothetical protein
MKNKKLIKLSRRFPRNLHMLYLTLAFIGGVMFSKIMWIGILIALIGAFLLFINFVQDSDYTPEERKWLQQRGHDV